MGRKTFTYTHGDLGVKPGNPRDFQKNERPQANEFDWFWYNLIESVKSHANEFDRLDANDDGIVDESDTITPGGGLNGVLNDSAGNRIYNDNGKYIEQDRLQNDSLTVAGNTVSLGFSTSIAHSDLSDSPASAHHTRYDDEEARDAVAALLSAGTDLGVSYDDAGDSLVVSHDNTSTQGDVATSGSTVIDDINLDGRGHLTSISTENRNIDHWENSGNASNNSVDADTVDGQHYSDIQTWVNDYVENNSTEIPNGVITMWSGTITDIPSGWTLCDGTDGAPNLQDRFVTGAGGQYSVGDTGGEDEHTLTEQEMPSHTHGYIDQNDNNTQGKGGGAVQANDFTNQTNSTGGDQAHENRPPYYAIAYIMEV